MEIVVDQPRYSQARDAQSKRWSGKRLSSKRKTINKRWSSKRYDGQVRDGHVRDDQVRDGHVRDDQVRDDQVIVFSKSIKKIGRPGTKPIEHVLFRSSPKLRALCIGGARARVLATNLERES